MIIMYSPLSMYHFVQEYSLSKIIIQFRCLISNNQVATLFHIKNNNDNDIKKIAGAGTKFMLINRFVSMIDGLFLAKKWNAENEVSLNLDVYPDLRNKSGVGRLKLTMGWK